MSDEVRIDIETSVPGAAGEHLAANLRARADVFSRAEIRAMRKFTLKSANYAASPGDNLLCDTTGASFILTLPPAPVAGDSVRAVGNGWDIHNLTVARNGQTIDGAAENLICDYDTDLTFIFVNNTWTY